MRRLTLNYQLLLAVLGILLSLCLSGTLLADTTSLSGQEDTAPTSKLHIVTEKWRPYSFPLDGQIAGESTQIVRQLLQAQNLSYDMSLHTWARTLKMAKSEKNTLIYPIVRTREREDKFHWIAPVAADQQVVFITHIDNKREAPYSMNELREMSAVTIIGTDKQHYLEENNFARIIPVTSATDLLKFVYLKRADLVLMDQKSIMANIDRSPYLRENFVVLRHAYSLPIYLAANLDTDEQVLTRLRQAFLNLRAHQCAQSDAARYPWMCHAAQH